MADRPDAADHAGDDDVIKLAALTERQQELWDLLRATDSDQERDDLLDELTANREELAQIKARVRADLEPTGPAPARPAYPQSVGEELRSRILSREPDRPVAPAQPPPPPPPPPRPPVVSAPILGTGAVEIPPVPDLLADDALPQPFPVEDPDAIPAREPVQPPEDEDVLLPEKTPYRTREDDLAATRPRREAVVESEPEPEPEPEMAPQVGRDETGIPDEEPPTAHETYRYIENMRPHHSRSRFRLLWIVIALLVVVALAGGAWYVFLY